MNLSPAAALLGGVVIALLVVAVWMWLHPRVSAGEAERRRRMHIQLHGRIRDAEVTDVRDWTVYYTYSVAGVVYTASQDVSSLQEHVPEELAHVVGPAGVKYLTRNPVDSIVLCEEWSGLRIPVRQRSEATDEPEPSHENGGAGR
ncbi:MAG: hypothetical protein NTY38_03835 [Acidobacteria bacterium]|nr:hypothetical protein [Acidobacteriota bacterium]